MWRELPADTRWCQVELNPDDLARIRFFPAPSGAAYQGNFYLKDVVERIRLRLDADDDDFFRKLRHLSDSLPNNLVNPTVLLIGVDETGPLTILDGNHRMAAAMLSSIPRHTPRPALHLRLLACHDSLLLVCHQRQHSLRYLRNLIRHFTYDAESDIGRFQESDS